jgi:hypothetical protein
MRAIALMPLLFVAACGGGAAEKNEVVAAPARIADGQWELTSEVTAFRALDEGAPKINTPVGTRATASLCVAGDRAPVEFFAGDGLDCEVGAHYVRNGRINVTLNCTREDLSGPIPVTADGRYTADTVDFERNTRTILASDGDVEIMTHVTGRRTGDCTATAAGGDNAAAPR